MDNAKLWTFFRVRFDFITELCGSVPANPKIAEIWTDAMKPKAKPPGGLSMDEINEEVLATLELAEGEEPPRQKLVFQRNPAGNGVRNLVLRAATFRAHMKDCARKVSKGIGKIEKEDTFSVKILNYTFHDERQYWIPIMRQSGQLVTEPDGERDKPVHANTRRGPISSIKTFEYVNDAQAEIILKVFNKTLGKEYKPMVPQNDLETLFYYGATHGYGGERSDGEGRYLFKIEQLESDPLAIVSGKQKEKNGGPQPSRTI